MGKLIYDFDEPSILKRFYLSQKGKKRIYMPFYKIEAVMDDTLREHFTIKCWKTKKEINKYLDEKRKNK